MLELYDPLVSLKDTYLVDTLLHVDQNMCSRVLIAAVFMPSEKSGTIQVRCKHFNIVTQCSLLLQ